MSSGVGLVETHQTADASPRPAYPGLHVVWLCVLAGCLFWLSTVAAFAQPKFPTLTGRIVDEANILSTQDRVEIEAMLRELEAKSSDQIVVYTAKSLQGYPIEDFGYQLGRAWKIGQAGTNNGVVLIVAPNERKVRIEVGRGLEGQMTDLMSGTIIRNGILPAFRRGDFSAGVKAGVRDIKDVLLGDAEEVKKRAGSIKPRGQQADWVPLVIFAVFILIWILMVREEQRQARLQPNMQRRRRSNGGIIVIPGSWGGSGHWPSGSGGSSDGGWSGGGGGDFGGGGASGEW